jgi:hypothetical protein
MFGLTGDGKSGRGGSRVPGGGAQMTMINVKELTDVQLGKVCDFWESMGEEFRDAPGTHGRDARATPPPDQRVQDALTG